MGSFVKWLGQFAEDGKSGKPSSKRMISLLAATCLSLGALVLLVAKARWVWSHGGDVSLEILAVTGPLCTLAGYNYVAGRKVDVEAKKDNTQGGQDVADTTGT